MSTTSSVKKNNIKPRAFVEFVALLPLFLPVIGIVNRIAAFQSINNAPFLTIAWSASIAQLDTAGAITLLPLLIIMIELFAWMSGFLKGLSSTANIVKELDKELDAIEKDSKSSKTDHKKIVTRILNAKTQMDLIKNKPSIKLLLLINSKRLKYPFYFLSVLIFLVFILFLPAFPWSFSLPFGGLLTIYTVYKTFKPNGSTFGSIISLLPAMIVMSLVAAITAGLTGIVPGTYVGDYKFSTSYIKDGRYLEIANYDNLTYLESCDGKRTITRSNDSNILVVQYVYEKNKSPSLWDLLHGNSYHVGVTSRC